jgi:uncharacterized membrane protein YbhN (UPF0104 family)
VGKTRKAGIRVVLRYIGFAAGLALLLYQLFQAIKAYYQTGLVFHFSWFLLVALLCAMAALGAQMWAWKLVMQGLGVSLSSADVVRGYVISFLPRYIPGTIWGYLSRSEWLFQEHKVAYKESNIGSILEIILAILANALWIGTGLWVRTNNPLWLLATGSGVILIFLGGFITTKCFSNRIWRMRLQGKGIFSYITVFSVKKWIASLGVFLINWLFYGFSLAMVVKSGNTAGFAFGADFGVVLTAVFCLSWLIGFLIVFAPAGLGFREVALSYLLSEYLAISMGEANAMAVASRVVILFSEVLWVVIGARLRNASHWKDK